MGAILVLTNCSFEQELSCFANFPLYLQCKFYLWDRAAQFDHELQFFEFLWIGSLYKKIESQGEIVQKKARL